MRLSKLPRVFFQHVVKAPRTRPRGVIFLIAHMRSLSSLLSHQIGSSPQVAGYFEAHQNYRNRLDFLELAEKIRRAGVSNIGTRYLFDKLVHQQVILDAVLRRKDLRIVLMVREPAATLRSLLRVGAAASVSAAADYYVERLGQMRELLNRRHGRALFLTSEVLVERSQIALAALTDYLGLEPPLSENYTRFPMTGKPKFGDPSKWILQGTVVRDRPEHGDDYANIEIPRRAYQAHADLCRHAETTAERVVVGAPGGPL